MGAKLTIAALSAKASKEAAAQRKANSKFIRWEHETTSEGKELNGEYKNIVGKIVEVKETVVLKGENGDYTVHPLLILVDGEDTAKEFGASNALMVTLGEAKVEVGDRVCMGRTGEARKTKYSAKKV